jgi:5'-nucleotidase
MNAQEIKQALEDGVSHYLDAGDSSGSFPYAYALRYDINTSQPRNHRITHLEYMDKKTLAWSPLQADQNYSVITHSYLASGHDGYATFAQIPQERKVNTYIDYAMSFVKYLKKQTQEGNEIEKLPYDLVPIQCYIDANHTQCPLP